MNFASNFIMTLRCHEDILNALSVDPRYRKDVTFVTHISIFFPLLTSRKRGQNQPLTFVMCPAATA
jgi:hypothetical protein